MCLQAAVYAVLSSTPLLAEDKPTALSVKPGPPAGFEEMAEPQETEVDVSYGGLKIGSFRAVYTPTTIAFATPDDLVAKIPSLKHDAIPRITQALTGALPTEAKLMCGPYPKKECGILKPDVAGVIFYEQGFHVDLFVNPAFLDTQDTHTEKILPPAPNVFSAVHQFNIGATGSPGSANSERDYSLLGNSTIAYGPGRLNIVGIASNEQRQLNTFTASLDKWGLDNEAGLFNSRALQLIPQVPMSGVSVGTSLKTNLALRDAPGSRLEVFLTQRSYVSLVYNNVIYSTDLYDAGNQVLNTSALPEGAYEVTIRIRDLSGAQTEEKRFFAKNFAIPPRDQPIYFAQAGTVRNISTTGGLTGLGNQPLFTAGMIRRLGENSALDTDFLLINNNFFTEAGAFLLLPPNHQFQVSSLLSTSGDYGFGTSYLGYMLDKKLAFNTNLRIIFARRQLAPNPAELGDPIQGNTKQLTSSVTYQMTPKANIGFQANLNQSEGAGTQYAYGPELRYDFWREGPNSLRLTADSDITQNGWQQTVMLNLIIRMGSWGFSGLGEFQQNPGTAGTPNSVETGDARVTWNDDKDPGRLTIIGAETSHSNTSSTYITDLDHRGSDGNLKLILSQTDTSGVNSTFYSGNFGFSIANTAHEVAWGGNEQETSGLIFENTGNSIGIPMKVTVDNAQKATFNTGSSTPLFLAPYQTYKVSIKPAQSASIDYDGSVKYITLYPGNVLPLIWDINNVDVIVGHVVLPGGTPLVDARLEEARNITVSDSEGLFQGEVLALKTITFKRAAQEAGMVHEDNDFSMPPEAHPLENLPSGMTIEQQRKAILSLFGEQEEGPPGETPPRAETRPQRANRAPVPIHKLRPAIRCRVTLPEVKETNGVYIYTDPLVCNPIPFEEEKTPAYGPVKPAQENKTSEKSGNPSWWDALKPTERQLNAITRMFAAAANRMPHPASGEPLPLMSSRPGTPQGGPFLTHTSPAAPETAPAEEQHPAKAAPVSSTTPAPATEELRWAKATPPAGAFEVQVGSYGSEAKAKEAQKLLVRRYAEFDGRVFTIIRADLGEKGTYYRLRTGGFASSSEAKAFCDTLSGNGQACMPLPKGTK